MPDPATHTNHDWLCPSHYTFTACECALIETVRQDERAHVIKAITDEPTGTRTTI